MDAFQLFERGLAAHKRGALADAERLYAQALELLPGLVPALSNRGAALRDLERPAEAIACYEEALRLEPNHVFVLNNRGVALIDLRRPAEALASFEQALRLKPGFAAAHNNRGRALANLDPAPDPQDALASFDRAIALQPDYAEAWDNKGVLLAELGRLHEAEQAIGRSIEIEPRRVRSYYHLADLRRFQRSDPILGAMKAIAGEPSISGGDRIELDFALAKAFDDIGEHELAWGRLAEGNALNRAQLRYDEPAQLATLERIALVFSSELIAERRSGAKPSPNPVFIIGMPRSGSTLIEQIIAGHPKAHAIGESRALPDTVAARGLASPEKVADARPQALAALGGSYLQHVRALAPEADRIIDKRLDNYRFAGLIALALPGARIIHVRRDARDTGLSCFFKLFGQGAPYASDLGELGRYWRGYEGLMAHWRAVLPEGVLLEVDYEALVADPEGGARRILDHCGLEWDSRCLDFHRSERRVRTASAAQVRRPVSADSIGRWRAYADHLGPLLEALGER
jgi:tetratricopeptide (TPR) repeat protein